MTKFYNRTVLYNYSSKIITLYVDYNNYKNIMNSYIRKLFSPSIMRNLPKHYVAFWNIAVKRATWWHLKKRSKKMESSLWSLGYMLNLCLFRRTDYSSFNKRKRKLYFCDRKKVSSEHQLFGLPIEDHQFHRKCSKN